MASDVYLNISLQENAFEKLKLFSEHSGIVTLSLSALNHRPLVVSVPRLSELLKLS